MTPFNFVEQSGKLWQAWSEQQQNWLKAITGAMPAVGATPAAPLASLEAGLSQVQDLWRGAIDKWMSLAPQGLATSGNVDDVLKALFDPAQWAQAGLGPLDRAIEHLVDGPSYATLWTLDRKMLRAQKLRAEWTRDLAAWQLIMQTAWNEALQRFIGAVHATDGQPIRTWRELADLWVEHRERHADGNASHAGVPRGAASPDAIVHRVPARGARDHGSVLRDAPHPDAHGSRRPARAPCTSCAASCARFDARPASAPHADGAPSGRRASERRDDGLPGCSSTPLKW